MKKKILWLFILILPFIPSIIEFFTQNTVKEMILKTIALIIVVWCITLWLNLIFWDE